MLDGINSSSIPQSKIYKMEEMNFESLKERVLFCEIDLQDGKIDGYLNEDQYKEFSEGCVAAKQEENKALSAELKDKQKPSLGLDKDVNEPNLTEDYNTFYMQPKDNTYIMFQGQKILYKDGKYSMPDRKDLEPNPNIYTFRSIIMQELIDNKSRDYKNLLQNATSNKEKRDAIDSIINDLSTWHNSLSTDFIKNNYAPGDVGKTFNFAGLTIKYTVSDEYKPIIDKEVLYRQANCLDD